ncbi:MAG TPA: peptidyl-prolyl cis-trans isomerase [Polyangia bacterium]|nr:peptidyl-prolyl cis-trans isomerase [Polyangia bacterium]
MRRAWLLMLVVGCGSKGPGPAAEPSDVVARVDGKPITLSEVQERINALDPYSKARYSSPEQRKRFLENLVRFEVLAREAEKRGYDRDPDVQRALKNQMIQVFLRKELDDKLKNEPITDAEVAKYYQDHERDFRQPEQVRVSQILVKDRALADKVAAEARRLPRQDDKGFRALVQQHSLDEDSKALGGDLTFFDRQNTELPRPLVEAAFALKEVGDVSAPVASDKGFHVLRLTQRRPGFTRPLEGVSAEIKRLISRDRRAMKQEEMVAQMRQKLKVQIYEDQLAKVTVEKKP